MDILHSNNMSSIGMLILQDCLFIRILMSKLKHPMKFRLIVKCQPRIPGVIFLISEFPLKQQVSSTARTRLPTSCTVR